MITSSAFSSSPFLSSLLLPSRSPGKTSDPSFNDFNNRDQVCSMKVKIEALSSRLVTWTLWQMR